MTTLILHSSNKETSKDSNLTLAIEILEIVPRVMREIRKCNQAYRKNTSGGDLLNLPHFRVLANIWRKSKTNKELAADIGLSVAAMSRVISKLEQVGFVSRIESKSDRREVEVHVTTKGLSYFKAVRKKTATEIATSLKRFTMEEKKQLSQGLELMSKVKT